MPKCVVINFWYLYSLGHAVVQLVKALLYNPEGSGFDCVTGNFFEVILPAARGPGFSSAFNGNEYQEYFLGGGGGVNEVASLS